MGIQKTLYVSKIILEIVMIDNKIQFEKVMIDKIVVPR